MSWKPELDEIAKRRVRAQEMGGEERIARHLAAGRLLLRLRERLRRWRMRRGHWAAAP